MDRVQLIAFCDYMIGQRVVGGNDPGDPLTTPHSPELLAFITARLGDNTPSAGYTIVPFPGRRQQEDWARQAVSLASLLREVANGLDAPDKGDPTGEEKPRPPYIEITEAEVRSGVDRVKWAEGLILQLPATHDGRNSWLLAYGVGPISDGIRKRYEEMKR